MGLPKGTNNGAHGVKGRSGRKSIGQEKADYEMLEKMFLNEMAKEDVQKKLASGKYSLKDVFVSKAFAGNERLLSQVFHKLFPDQSTLNLNLVKPLPTDKADSKIKKLYAKHGISNIRRNRQNEEDEPGGQSDNS